MIQVELEQVFKDELAAIAARRTACGRPDTGKPPGDLFGFALSGGGIRSATVSLGILDVLNKCKVLCLVDYLSTVSGGGYIGGHVHAKLKDTKGLGGFGELFGFDDIRRLSKFGYYLAPGKGLREFLNECRLAAAYLASVVMNWVWVALLFLVFFFVMQGLVYSVGGNAWRTLCNGLLVVTAAVLSYHFFFHGLRYARLWSSEVLYVVEALLLLALLIDALGFLTIDRLTLFPCIGIPLIGDSPWSKLFAVFLLLGITGFFANPNILTMHRFYRDRLAAAYLKTPGADFRRVKLSEIGPGRDNAADCPAPYPLINACLNVSGKNEKRGAKSCDYFLLSPLYCGSSLTRYVRTASPGFKHMTLATAVAISGAAINPNMGVRTNRALAFLMTLLDLRLGYWAANPMTKRLPRLSWWPYYHVMELFGNANVSRRRVSITDGGHIENLGIYELLRRKCRLIIAVDASADPEYAFSDLKNLVIRARNELGLSITFRENPETVIRPLPSMGFSDSHVSIADIQNLPGKDRDGKYEGLLVYVKSSLKATARFKTVESDSYVYKTNHPAFPHESTAEQFFDKAQWRAYYNLGRFIAGDLLGVEVTEPTYSRAEDCDVRSIDQLLLRFRGTGKAKQA